MSDDKTTHGDQEPEPTETRPTDTGPAANDPGPIEVDHVMKRITPPVHDPMEGRDPHFHAAWDDEADAARGSSSA